MRVLLIAYYYPPLGSGGSLRPARAAARLRQSGHEVAVLTHSYHGDRETPDELQAHDPSHNCDRQGRHWASWALRRAAVELLNRAGAPSSIYTPWQRRAVALATRCLPAGWPSVILATYPPVETLEVGLELARRWQVSLVADFRDGLLFEPIERTRLARYAVVRTHYRRVEESTAQRSRAMVAVFPRLQEYLATAYPGTPVHLIPNGFDPAEFVDLPVVELEPGPLHLVHAGSMALSYADRDVGPLARALESVVDAGQGQTIRFHQLGRLTRTERRATRRLAELGVWVDHGEVDRPTCLAFQRQADVLVLLTSTARSGAAPGKLFEYLGAGRPIVALAGDSWAAEIVRSTRTGWVVPPANGDAITELLLKMTAEPELLRGLAPDSDAIRAFTVDRGVAELERILQRAAGTLALDEDGGAMAESRP